MAPGRLTLLSGARAVLRGFHQELAHFAIHQPPDRYVLWADGDHGMNPYDFAELNLERGHEADAGADRVLVKRCMTPFQWDTVLTKHIDQKLVEVDVGLVLATPFDQQFSTDELQDWEQEDYVAFSLKHLKGLARRHRVPIVLSVDMARWWHTHPTLAKLTYEAAEARWSIAPDPDGWRAEREDGLVIEPVRRPLVTLRDWMEAPNAPVPVPRPPRRS